MKSVIIADDLPLMLDSLTNYISDTNIFDTVISVENGLELLEEFEERPVDLLIIDLAMPKMSGFDVLKEIRKRDSNVKILIISNFDSCEIILKSLLLGSDGFIPKLSMVNKFERAFKYLKQNDLFFSEEITEKTKSTTHNYLTGLECYEIKTKLSKREYEVFNEVGPSGNSYEVCNKLCVAQKTIDNHLEKIKNKLNLKNKNELYRIANFHYQVYGKR